MLPHYPTQYFVEYDNPYNVSMSGMFGQPAGCHAILYCDVPLTLGCDFAWNQFQWPAGPQKRAAQCDELLGQDTSIRQVKGFQRPSRCGSG
jgi:thiamine pyrophosphate-dependent acetolactate synthase large subunit-like protein